jgi:hypothetical protein
MAYLRLTNPETKTVVQVVGEPGEGLAPWGLTHDGKIIFADKGVAPPKVGSKYSQYDRNSNVRRRVRFESYLAALVLLDAGPVMPAIRKLNRSIGDYVENRQMLALNDNDMAKRLADLGGQIRSWLYNDDLGRLGKAVDAPEDPADIVAAALKAADQGSLQQVLNVHATIIGKVIPLLGYRTSGEHDIDEGNKARLKPGALFDEDKRGRKKRAQQDAAAVTTVGIQHPKDLRKAAQQKDPELATLLEPHPRAIGTFERSASPQQLQGMTSSGNESPFVASFSGSTTELLRLALLYGQFDEEGMKQYTIAVAAFLIGGGHHSFHEVMSIARLAGLSYKDGAYDSMLPLSFKRTAWYDQLIDGFPDILFSEYWPEVSLNFAVPART